jgi:hypothetical protein
MEKVLKIEDFEDKATATGRKYARFKTSEGWISCFDSKSTAELKKHCGSEVKVDLIQSGDFQNIKKFISANGTAATAPEEIVETVKVASNGNTKKEMYVSFAKDCFCAIITRISQAKFDDMEEEEILALMDLSIKAVNKATEAL